MIHYECPHCAHKLSIPEEFAGQKGQCDNCAGVISVPEPMTDLPTFEAAPPNPGIPKPILYGGAAVAGMVVLMATYFVGSRFVNDDYSDEVDALIDASEYGRSIDTNLGLRDDIEGLDLQSDRVRMEMQLNALQAQLDRSKSVTVKTATQRKIDALNSELSDLAYQLEAEGIRKRIDRAKREVQVARGAADAHLQDALAIKLGHGDASNQIDETGEHSKRIHALLNVTRGQYLDAGDPAIEAAIEKVKVAAKYFPTLNNEACINYLNNTTAAKEGQSPTLEAIAQEIYAYLEFEYYRPQMEARQRQQANRKAVAEQIAANRDRYKEVGAAVNAEKEALRRSYGPSAEAVKFTRDLVDSAAAGRRELQRRIKNR